MPKISVSEAAQLLDVHVQRVHQLIASGALPAERVGRQWVIERADVARHDRRGAGRPLSARSAWNLVAVAAEARGHEDEWSILSPSERSRARARLREFLALFDGPAPKDEREVGSLAASLRALLKNRAERLSFNASRRDLGELRSDDRLRLSGISLPGSGIASGDIVEGYVEQGDVDRLVHDYLLAEGGAANANVILHVFDPDSMPQRGFDASNWLLLAVDLADHHRPREQARAVEIVSDMLLHVVGHL